MQVELYGTTLVRERIIKKDRKIAFGDYFRIPYNILIISVFIPYNATIRVLTSLRSDGFVDLSSA